jgi:hypothetical protein
MIARVTGIGFSVDVLREEPLFALLEKRDVLHEAFPHGTLDTLDLQIERPDFPTFRSELYFEGTLLDLELNDSVLKLGQ